MNNEDGARGRDGEKGHKRLEINKTKQKKGRNEERERARKQTEQAKDEQ